MNHRGVCRAAPGLSGFANKHGAVTITTSSGSDFQLPLAGLQKNTPGSVLLDIKQMP